LNGFVLVVVGTERFPYGLHVSIHDGACAFRLSASEEPDELVMRPARRSIHWI
jgi:hypothetical protein